MYLCQRCRSDVTGEVEAEISSIVNGPAPMSLGSGDVTSYFSQSYVCNTCRAKERATHVYRGGQKKG